MLGLLLLVNLMHFLVLMYREAWIMRLFLYPLVLVVENSITILKFLRKKVWIL